MLKRTKKSKNDLINAEEGEDHFTDISSVGEDNIKYNNIFSANSWHITAVVLIIRPLAI